MVSSVSSSTSSYGNSGATSTASSSAATSASAGSLASIGSSIINSVTGATINIQSLAQQLTDAENLPQQSMIDTRKAAADAKISSIGQITSSANTFLTALNGLGDPKAIAFSPQTSDPTVASFSFSSFIVPKQMDMSFVVQQLATDNSVTLPQFDSKAAVLGTSGADAGTMTITRADGTVVDTIALSGSMTLNDIADKITADNSNNNTGLNATVLNGSSSGQGGNWESLKINNGTGLSNNFTVSIAYTNAGSPLANNPTGLAVSTDPTLNTSYGQDAKIYVGGHVDPNTGSLTGGNQFSSASNTFSTLVSGVNITVNSVTANSNPVSLTTATNISGLENAVQAIVQGYNSLLQTVQSQIAYNTDPQKKGGLANDDVARNFISQMQQLTTNTVTAADGSTGTLAQLGVKTNLDGTLTVDLPTLDQVAQNNPKLLANVISSRVDSTTGATIPGSLDQMINLCNIITGPTSDLQTELKTTQTTTETAISDDQTKLDDQMTALYNRYISQFTAMQSILSSSKTDQTSLTNMMSSWSANMK